MKSEIKKRIESEQTCMSRITNEMLLCKDCSFRHYESKGKEKTSTCSKYQIKPNDVLLGGNECEEYVKEK